VVTQNGVDLLACVGLVYARRARRHRPVDETIADWILALRDRGVRAASVNAYIRSFTADLSFLRGRGVPCAGLIRQ
jgi:hypothetical protein